MELTINYIKNSTKRKFEEYDNFYTILHKRKVVTMDNNDPGNTDKWKIKHLYKIIYGHIVDDDFLDMFDYKVVHNGKIQYESMTHRCKLSDLQKPNSNEKFYKIFTYPEILSIKKYHDENAKLDDYVKFVPLEN